MHPFAIVMIVLAACIWIILIFYQRKKKPSVPAVFPDSYRYILAEQVPFFRQLNSEKKKEFETRMLGFLSNVHITGVKTIVEETDRVLIAASAIIPIFGFPGWEYNNLNEVLLYPDSFGDEFEQEGPHRNTLGMVGTGAFNHVMILSQRELRTAFLNEDGRTNTAIHEFVHLVDKTDGSIDGIPEYFMHRKYVLPWLDLMQKKIHEIMANNSDINPYGATNEAEFFAVASEYFFERPDLLQSKHPELYELLSAIFNQKHSMHDSQSVFTTA